MIKGAASLWHAPREGQCQAGPSRAGLGWSCSMTAGMAQAEDFSSLTLEEEPEVVTQQHAPKTSFFFFFNTTRVGRHRSHRKKLARF